MHFHGLNLSRLAVDAEACPGEPWVLTAFSEGNWQLFSGNLVLKAAGSTRERCLMPFISRRLAFWGLLTYLPTLSRCGESRNSMGGRD
jgi:hypothetical protein